MNIRIPSFLHDLFGESQTPGELLAIAFFSVGLSTVLFFAFPEITRGLPLWRSAIAYLLIVDVFAGCIANFTRSTNNYYAARARERLVFIAVHVHPLVVAWLLGINLWQAVIVWGYTIGSAYVVNALKDNRFQVFIGGVLLAIGVPVVVLVVEAPKYFLVVSLLFMVKLLFGFAVDHYGQAQVNSLPQKQSI